MSADPTRPILEVSSLRLSIATDEGIARVLDNVDLRIARGEIVGLVGESGCGKSTLVRAILGILPRSARIEAGSIRFGGQELLGPNWEAVLRRVRGRAIGFVPQDPYLAFNPVFKIGTQLMEVLRSYGQRHDKESSEATGARRRGANRARLIELLRLVQIPDPESLLERYPHQVSGGQRQRLLIAGALTLNPSLVIADEPTTSLDVTTQREILRMLKDVARRLGISMLFISHDFGVVAQLCNMVSVMYAGQTVETAPTRTLLTNPCHPYTRALLACHPERTRELIGIPGNVPSPLRPPSGCRFRTRCPEATERCAVERPPEVTVSSDSKVACTLYASVPPKSEVEVPSIAAR